MTVCVCEFVPSPHLLALLGDGFPGALTRCILFLAHTLTRNTAHTHTHTHTCNTVIVKASKHPDATKFYLDYLFPIDDNLKAIDNNFKGSNAPPTGRWL